MNVGALDRREKGETTLIQTTDPTARVSIPEALNGMRSHSQQIGL